MRYVPALLSAAALVCLVNGCGSTGDGATSIDDTNPVGGLSVEELDEAAGKLVAKFEKDGRTIVYDLRLGPKMTVPPSSEDLRENPELPTYEVDGRVLDANGAVFHLQMGGDTFIDASWTMPHVENFHELGRLKDIQLMRDAVSAFRKLSVPKGVEQLRFTAIRIGLGVEGVPYKPGVAVFDPEQTPEEFESPDALQPLGIIAWGPGTVGRWDFLVRKQSIGGILGEHSAVHLRGWLSNGGVVFNAYSCNHGNCAYNMGIHCVMPGWKTDDGTHSRYFYSDGCTTSYSWSSGFGAHNCNDDSELQGKAIWYDSPQSTTGDSYGAWGFHNYAPGCTF